MFVDVYAIQTVPPSNINRDDTGAPKTAVYGGVRRARVSSQAWKRAMRVSFRDYLPEGSFGVRTKMAAELIRQRIADRREDLAGRASDLAGYVMEALGIKAEASKRAGDDEGKLATSYLIFISDRELDGLADLAIRWDDEGAIEKKAPSAAQKKAVKDVFHGACAVDVALFGRMLADVPELNTDAAAQVAHAISVDAVEQEYDYYTAVDDCASEDNSGAGMIGTIDFNSSTLYRYATVNLDALCEQLGNADAAAHGVAAFVEALVRSMPTGKQNTFANRTLPSAVLVALRETQPLNAVSAFEKPVRPGEEPIALQAARRLGKRVAEFEDAYDMRPAKAWNVVVGDPVEELDAVSEHVALPEMLAALSAAARAALAAED